ncbi:hypothetical protein KAJ87_00840 [Candidatus Pacearchaeota archaeon]|nr:hypothetical protein [Candidatus Pacearchaeota archaeon]
MKIFNLENEDKKNVPVTLVENISYETGEKMLLDELDDNRKYRLRIRRDKGIVYYPSSSFPKRNLKLEIQCLNLLGISGEYFVAPKRGRK